MLVQRPTMPTSYRFRRAVASESRRPNFGSSSQPLEPSQRITSSLRTTCIDPRAGERRDLGTRRQDWFGGPTRAGRRVAKEGKTSTKSARLLLCPPLEACQRQLIAWAPNHWIQPEAVSTCSVTSGLSGTCIALHICYRRAAPNCTTGFRGGRPCDPNSRRRQRRQLIASV